MPQTLLLPLSFNRLSLRPSPQQAAERIRRADTRHAPAPVKGTEMKTMTTYRFGDTSYAVTRKSAADAIRAARRLAYPIARLRCGAIRRYEISGPLGVATYAVTR